MNRAKTYRPALALLCALAAGCAAPRPYLARVAVESPGASPQAMDARVAAPLAARLFGASGEVREVTAVSTAGRCEVYAISETSRKPDDFLKAVTGALADAARELPADAAAGRIELLPPGAAVPDAPIHFVEQIRVDADRAKLAEAGVTAAQLQAALDKAGGLNGHGAAGAATESAARPTPDTLAAIPLPTPRGRVTLGDVAVVHYVKEPDRIVRHLP